MERDGQSKFYHCIIDDICLSLIEQTAFYLSVIILSSVLFGFWLAYVWLRWPKRHPPPAADDEPQEPPIQAFARKRPPPAESPSDPEAGNVFFMLFGAVTVLGLIGAGTTTYIKGPVRSMANVSLAKEVSLDLATASSLLIKAARTGQSGDCDDDTFLEPLPTREPGPGQGFPAGGGLLPSELGAVLKDPWKSDYGYCAWDLGPTTVADNDPGCGGSAARRLGGGDLPTQPVLAIISSGPDRVFQTVCNAWTDANADDTPDTVPIVKPAGSDDIVRPAIYGTAVLGGGGSAQLQPHPDEACTPDSIGLMRYEMGTVQVCTAGGWEEVGGAISASGDFTPTTNAELESEQTSNEISFAGFSGTRTATVDGGAVILVNGIEVGASAPIVPGDLISLRGPAGATPETTTTYTLTVGTVQRPWTITTRDATAAALTITPATQAAMDVAGPGSPAYGAAVSFLVRNTGETATTLFSAVLSNVTNFEFHSGGGHVGDDCAGKTLAKDDTCVLDVRPRASTGGAFSGTLTASDGSVNAVANLSGNASGWTCPLPWGGTINEGQQVTAYQASSVPYGSTCQSEQRTCTAGGLDGTYMYESCSVAAAANCTLDGVTVNHNSSRDFYSVQTSTNCSGNRQSRTCTNGDFNGSGTYQYANCSAPPAVTFTAAGSHSWTVPAGVTSIIVKAWGGGGSHGFGSQGGIGGGGGYTGGNLAVTPGETLTVVVGGGSFLTPAGGGSAISPGGNGGYTTGSSWGGGGGGASGIRRGGTNLLIAPGGGGGGSQGNCGIDGKGGDAGSGGGTSGKNGSNGGGAGGAVGGSGAGNGSNGIANGNGEASGTYCEDGADGGGGGGGHAKGRGGKEGTGTGGGGGGGGGSALVPSGGTTVAGNAHEAGNNADADYGMSAGRATLPGRVVIKPN